MHQSQNIEPTIEQDGLSIFQRSSLQKIEQLKKQFPTIVMAILFSVGVASDMSPSAYAKQIAKNSSLKDSQKFSTLAQKPFPNAPEWERVSALSDAKRAEITKPFNQKKVQKKILFKKGKEKLSLMKDGPVYIYTVRKGDTKSQINQTLRKFSPAAFEYLNPNPGDGRDIKSDNIHSKNLRAGMNYIVPMPPDERILGSETFMNYAYQGIFFMKNTPGPYQKGVQEILDHIPAPELATLMLAIAKQESGGKPLGQMEFYRVEPSGDYSIGIFHTILNGPKSHASTGRKALEKLGFTEGQIFHPENAVKLFLGYLVEKIHEARRPKTGEKIFSFSGNLSEFLKTGRLTPWAEMYNGAWRRQNPLYAKQLFNYYNTEAKLLGISLLPPHAENNPLPELVKKKETLKLIAKKAPKIAPESLEIANTPSLHKKKT